MYSIKKHIKKIIIVIAFAVAIIGFVVGIPSAQNAGTSADLPWIAGIFLTLASISTITFLGLVFSKGDRKVREYRNSVEQVVKSKHEATEHASKALKASQNHAKHKEKIDKLI